MARPLKVYVSCALDELADERIALKQALQGLPLSVDWQFDFTSASGKVSAEYLERVWDAQLFILLLGQRLPEPLVKEFETAVEAEKPIIVLLQDVRREKEAVDFVRGLRIKPRPRYFDSIDQLKYQVEAGVSDELIKNFRKLRLDEEEMRQVARRRVENIARERQGTRDWKATALLMGTLLVIVAIAVLVGRGGRNDPPVIERVDVNPAVVTVGETATLRVFARDPEGGQLMYQWLTTSGKVEPPGQTESPLVTFLAPDRPGPITVRVVASDPLGLEAEKNLEIDVVKK